MQFTDGNLNSRTVTVRVYWTTLDNLDNLIAKLRAFTEDGRRTSRAKATRVKAAVFCVCSKFNSIKFFFDMYG